MRILISDYPGHPFQVQLSRYLAQKGHQVLHVYFQSIVAPRGSLERLPDDPPTFEIRGISLKERFHKYNFPKRLQQEIQYGKLMAEQITSFKPDIMLSSNNPLDAQNILWDTCQKLSIPRVFWLQDFWGIAIKSVFQKKLPLLGTLVGNRYINLEKKLVKNSDGVILITDAFSKILTQWNVPSAKMHVIPNWAPLHELPVGNKVNAWSKDHSLDSDFVFLYSGTLGLKHNPELLLNLARHFQGVPSIKVVVTSQGLGADWLRKQKEALHVDNLLLLDYQSFAQMPNMLASADVLIAILEQAANVYSVPSKVLTYLCAKRPILLSVPPDNLAAQIVSDNKAGYVTTQPEEFIQAAEKLFRESELRRQMGHNARKYAEDTFNIEKIGAKFEKILEQCISGDPKCNEEH